MREGDRLLLLLNGAREEVILCAPFMKRRTVARLLDAVVPEVPVTIYTRWRPEEVRAGVSDLEVFDIVEARVDANMLLVDELHAKLYVVDGQALIGSANLTATALGWTTPSNLELLHLVDRTAPDVDLCLQRLSHARAATREEALRIQAEADKLTAPELPMSNDLAEGERPGLWLPSMSAPNRLYEAYDVSLRDRLSPPVLSAAQVELEVLDPPHGLTRKEFEAFVATRILEAPAMRLIADRIEKDDLTDRDAMDLIEGLAIEGNLPTHRRWEIVREWLTTFFDNRFEIVAESFVIRRRPGIRSK